MGISYSDFVKAARQQMQTGEEKERRLQELSVRLAKLMQTDGVVYTPKVNELRGGAEKSMDHVLGYAKAVQGWEGKPNGNIDMYFDRKTGMPLGYSYGDENGIHADVSDRALARAIVYSTMNKALAAKRGMLPK